MTKDIKFQVRQLFSFLAFMGMGSFLTCIFLFDKTIKLYCTLGLSCLFIIVPTALTVFWLDRRPYEDSEE